MQKCIALAFIFCLTNLCCLQNVHARADLNFYLGVPYVVNPLGEGASSPYAKGPLFRDDGFDCTTYVEAILTQYKQNVSENDFQKKLMLLRYIDGKVGYFSRAHLMELHWIPNALKYKFISEYSNAHAMHSKVRLNLQNWFLKNEFVVHKDEAYLTNARKQPVVSEASIPYIPTKYIDENFIKSLPSFMVVFFLKDIPANTWAGQDTRQSLITHMGMLKDGQLYHASLKHKKVIKIHLLDYLERGPKYIGVSFYEAVP